MQNGRGPTNHFLTDIDGIDIAYYRWDIEHPRALIHIAHGAGEHAKRYDAVARSLNNAGYSVAADDHRGHGVTANGVLSDLGPRNVTGAIDSVQRIGEELVREAGDIPVVLLGHSWGSLMAQKIIARSPLYDGVVLTGTSLAVPWIMNIGDLNKKWRRTDQTGLAWLSRDPGAAQAFMGDPFNFDIAQQPIFTKSQALALIGRPPRRLPRQIPILIMGGSDDSLGGTRGMTALYDAYRQRSAANDIAIRIYEGARHEILLETNRAEVIADLSAWLDRHFHKEAGSRRG